MYTMLLRFSVVLAAISSNAIGSSASAEVLAAVPASSRQLLTCSDYDISYPTTTGTTIFWTNGGGSDSEWINKSNWQYGYLPGVSRFNRLIMAVNDVVTVHCDATYV